MAPIIPYIPETITVHLGPPDSGAERRDACFAVCSPWQQRRR